MSRKQHDKVRLGELRTRIEAAIAGLTAIRSTDPAAIGAIHAVRLTERTLETFWLPAIDELNA